MGLQLLSVSKGQHWSDVILHSLSQLTMKYIIHPHHVANAILYRPLLPSVSKPAHFSNPECSQILYGHARKLQYFVLESEKSHERIIIENTCGFK